ncbi:MAG: hypothetical protein ACJ8AT_16285 [Hyalangium sp.]|uniref:hypothetical protein n=1 Tax=Hyalangium sp. TaxID=2028555 RepID=UPI00389AF25C
MKDPVIAYFVSIPTGIACSLIASAIDRAWQRHQGASAKEPLPEQLGVVIKIGEGPEAFSHKGTVLEPAWVKHMLAHQKEARRAYREVRARKSPYPSLPVPLFEEHIPRVVGWGAIDRDEGEFVIREMKITSKVTRNKIDNGVLRGLSVGGIAEVSVCSICREDCVACNHISGEHYGSEKCVNHIERSVLADVSFVKEPINPECLLWIR